MTDIASSPEGEAKAELRVIDQTLSAYCDLRDRYRAQATTMSLVLLVAGAALLALSFGSDEVLGALGLGASASGLVAGALGTVVFAVSLIELRLNWAERAALYGAAAERHARWKAQYRNFLKGRTRTASGADDLRREYQAVSAAGPGIPERDFLPLKQKHLRKVRLSQMLDDSPGTPMWILRWRLFREGIDRQDNRS